jgi:hypothetical protein
VVCLQHEYGIFGGQRGGFIIELVQDLKIPLITTLHTVLRDPSRPLAAGAPNYRAALRAVLQISSNE